MEPLNHIVASIPDVEWGRTVGTVTNDAAQSLRSTTPMPGKRPIPIPTSRRKAVQGAMLLAMSALQDERVREQLRKAPVAAREWAATRRATDAAESTEPSPLERLDPTRRFGHRGLERRVAALERNARLVFPNQHDADGRVILQAIDELRRATAISATMPLNDRRRARTRIGAEVTRLEQALVDAVLPPTTT